MAQQEMKPKAGRSSRRVLRLFLWSTQIMLFASIVTCSKGTGPEPTENRPPTIPAMTSTAPPQGSSDQPIRPTLRWTCSDPDNDSLRYDLYFGIDSVPPLVDSQRTVSEYQPGTLQFETKYFWRVVAKDGFGNSTSSPTWNFRTVSSPKLIASPEHVDFGSRIDSAALSLVYLGSDTITWKALSNRSWLRIVPDSGTISAQPESMMIVAVRDTLPSGFYSGTIQFTSAVGIASVEVSITIGALTWEQEGFGIGRPPARQSHTAVVDSMAGQLVIFAGWDYGTERNDVWFYDLSAKRWSRPFLSGSPPSPRAAHTAIYDPVNRSMLVFGGVRANFTPTILGDLVRLNLVTDSWEAITVSDPKPDARFNHTAIYDPVSEEMVIYGGLQTDSTFGDVWRFSPALSRWSKVTPAGADPGPRDGHSAIYYPPDHSMIIFGGWVNGAASNEVWKLNLSTNLWTQIITSGVMPAPRTRHSVAYTGDRESMLLFGGQGTENQEYNDLWSLNLKTGEWSVVPVDGPLPSARSSQTLNYDPQSHSFVLYAGWAAGPNGRRYLDDLWRLGP